MKVSSWDCDFLNWFAGLWEGEGYVGIYKRNRNSPTKYGKIGVSQCNPKPLLLIQSIFGGGVYPHNGGPDRIGKKPVYSWCLCSSIKLIEILNAVLPFLRFRQQCVKQVFEEIKEIDSKQRSPRWTQREISFLKENYGKIPTRLMAEGAINRHSEGGIQQKARKLALKRHFGKELRTRDSNGRLRRKF